MYPVIGEERCGSISGVSKKVLLLPNPLAPDVRDPRVCFEMVNGELRSVCDPQSLTPTAFKYSP